MFVRSGPASSAMEEYDSSMRALGERLLAMFFKALGLAGNDAPGGETERKIRETLTSTIHLNMYVNSYGCGFSMHRCRSTAPIIYIRF